MWPFPPNNSAQNTTAQDNINKELHAKGVARKQKIDGAAAQRRAATSGFHTKLKPTDPAAIGGKAMEATRKATTGFRSPLSATDPARAGGAAMAAKGQGEFSSKLDPTDPSAIGGAMMNRAIPPNYKHGGTVKKSGMAMVHKGEKVIAKKKAKDAVMKNYSKKAY